MVLLMSSIPVSAGEPGANLDPTIEGTPVDSIVHDNISFDFKEWSFSVALTEDAIANNTTLNVSTQICVNSGFCHPPTSMELEESENGTYAGTVTPMEDHTYVNWRIILTYENDSSEKIPDKGWSKTWSDCWLDTYSEPPLWGGEGCPDEREDEDKTIPSIGILGTAATLMLAGVTFLGKKK